MWRPITPVATRPADDRNEFVHLMAQLDRAYYIRFLTATERTFGLDQHYTCALCSGLGQLVRYAESWHEAKLYAFLHGLAPCVVPH